MSLHRPLLSFVVLLTTCTALATAQEHHKGHATPKNGVCVLVPTAGNHVEGVILFAQHGHDTHLTGEIRNLTPGLHGFHIHEYGDLRDPSGKSAGGHYNPAGHKHGGPGKRERHAGDLGNIKAGADGVAKIDIVAKGLALHFAFGRSIVVHAGADDLKSQPSGNAGPRAAVGVIGIAAPPKKD